VNDLRNANGGMVNPAVDKHFGFFPGVTYRHLIAVEPRMPKAINPISSAFAKPVLV